MVVPCLRHHLQRHQQTDSRSHHSRSHGARTELSGLFLGGVYARLTVAGGLCRTMLAAQSKHDQTPQAYHSHSHPDREGIERTGKGIVAFAGLSGSLIEIKHDGDTCHEEEEEHHPELLDASLRHESLPAYADDAEQQREHIENVVTLVFAALVGRKQTLVAETRIVDKGYSRYPVAAVHLAVALYVVLSSGKVPHEVAPVHVIELIYEEEVEIFGHRGLELHGLLHGIALLVDIEGGIHRFAPESDPVGVGLFV